MQVEPEMKLTIELAIRNQSLLSADSKHVSLSRRKSPESSRSRRGKRSKCGSPLLALCLLPLQTRPLVNFKENSLPLSPLACLCPNVAVLELGLGIHAFIIDDIFRSHPQVHRSYMLLYQ